MTAQSHDMRLFKLCHTAFLMAFFFVLPACDLYEESWTTTESATVSQERFYEAFEISAFNENTMRGLAHTYDRHGASPMNVSITYDPKSHQYTALSASNDAARISKALRAEGVRDLEIDVLPSPSYAGQILVSYEAYHAQAPKNCGSIPGLNSGEDIGKSAEDTEQYALGCTTKTLMAQQIARPKDLLGNRQTQAVVDGRRVSNVIETYRDGVPNEVLEGETATDE